MSIENIEFSYPVNNSDELNLYDLHLSSKEYHSVPDLNGLTERVSPDLQQTWNKLIQTIEQKLTPGFMGLNLPANLAAELLERIEKAGGYGLVVPIGYRHPKITIEMAYPIAAQETAQIQALQNYKVVEPTKFCRQEVMWWEFRAIVPELADKGCIPGCVIVSVDKLDGHIWTSAEQIHVFAGEEYYFESATSLEPMEVLNLVATQLGLEWSIDRKHQNKPCLKGSALVVGAEKLPFQTFIQKKYGFRPTVHMWFRLNRYKQRYEVARALMMQVVQLVLQHDLEDGVLLFDESTLNTVIQRISGKLIIDEQSTNWIDIELA